MIWGWDRPRDGDLSRLPQPIEEIPYQNQY
jgi:hypothetical protein